LVFASLGRLDWAVLAGYLVVLAGTGVAFSLRAQRTSDDYFLAGRRMPWWAVAVSIVATSMSAVSFIGVPESSYGGDLTYLSTNLGMIIAAVVVATVFVPAFYRAGVTSIYSLLERRYGHAASMAASVAYLAGRVLASGARIYAGSLAFSIVLFGYEEGSDPAHLGLAIGAMTVVGILYTLIGGVASVIWTDVIQMAVFIGAAGVAIWVLLTKIDAPIGGIVSSLAAGGEEGASKLTVINTSLSWTDAFSLQAAVIGFAVMGIASYGTDQDLAQRLLTCKNQAAGAKSIVGGILLGIPSVAVFLVVGLLLWVYDSQETGSPGSGTERVFLRFIVHDLPPGLPGLMMAGLFAAGLSSVNSSLNAMSSSLVSDVLSVVSPRAVERHAVLLGRLGVVAAGLALGGFALVCIEWQRSSQLPLLDFALGVMTFAYAGLVGVFAAALFTRRGSAGSVIAALVAGAAVVLLGQGFTWSWLESPPPLLSGWLALAFVWKLLVGAAVSFGICVLPAGPERAEP
jgi:SSS family transporter